MIQHLMSKHKDSIDGQGEEEARKMNDLKENKAIRKVDGRKG